MRAIIIVDCQNDFGDQGSLPVKGGILLAEKIADFIESLDLTKYKLIFTRDYHPLAHISFKQWPPHCIVGTNGANYMEPLLKIKKDCEILKGESVEADSYSGFYVGETKKSKLDVFLDEFAIKDVYICGLVKDICVLATANDAVKFGYNATVITDLTLAISEQEYKKNIDSKVKNIIAKEMATI